MKQKYANIVIEALESAGIAVDVATRNPIERIGRDVDSGKSSWSDGLSAIRSSAKLYRLSSAQHRALESALEKNFR